MNIFSDQSNGNCPTLHRQSNASHITDNKFDQINHLTPSSTTKSVESFENNQQHLNIADNIIKESAMSQLFANAVVDIDLLEKQIASNERERQYTELSGSMPGLTNNKRNDHNIDGDNFDTLDEPISVTVKRDLHAIGIKFGHVLFPMRNRALLRDWDLWGPLVICVFISLLLRSDDKGPNFSQIFMLTFFGACLVTLNIKLLGGTISFFQSLCVLGYCLLPTAASALICKMLKMASDQSEMLFIIRLLVTATGFIWATYASMAFLSGSQPPRRKALAIYPIFLFYFVVSWLIISHS